MGHDSRTDGKQNLQKEQEHPTNLAKGLYPQVVLKTKKTGRKNRVQINKDSGSLGTYR
jgi:hypothetical protein